MKHVVTTNDLTVLLKKTSALWKAAEVAQKISTDLDMDKDNMKTADESIISGQKRLAKGNVTKRQRGKIERTIEYHQELLACTEIELDKKLSEFSEAITRVESVLRDLAELHANLAKVPRFEHA
jgi:lipopolysaccharide biosynthesis regulator YciM